uniref:DNA/RNA non-specific endonuclease domain-containing protein n=1 Tax=Strigamia maritima TaxID=126957 RepID=T1JEC8_STRMM
MNHIRLIYLTTTAAFTGTLFGTITNKLRHKFLLVNAQPSSSNFIETPLTGSIEPHKPPQGSPGIQGWIHKPGSDQWIAAIDKPGGFEKLWIPYEKGGHIFPHFEVPTRIELEYKDFLLCYDNETKTPVWVLEQMTYDGLRAKVEHFYGWCRNDARIPDEFQPTRDDYQQASKRFKPLSMARLDFHKNYPNDSFVFTNVTPKVVKDCNSYDELDLWDELFYYVYYLSVTNQSDHVFLLSGPLYVPKFERESWKTYRDYELVGVKEVGVPTHFFKVIVSIKRGKIRFECFKFENKAPDGNLDLRQFSVPREELEKEAGFTIFGQIQDRDIWSTTMEPQYVWNTYEKKKQEELRLKCELTRNQYLANLKREKNKHSCTKLPLVNGLCIVLKISLISHFYIGKHFGNDVLRRASVPSIMKNRKY